MASEDTTMIVKRKSVATARTIGIGAGTTMMLVVLTIEMRAPGITIEIKNTAKMVVIGSEGIAVKLM